MLPLEIDGAHGEGGGQLLRTAVALAAVTGREILVQNIRARRKPPGLAPQHLAAVRAVASLCHARAEGLEARSPALHFAPHALRGGSHRVDVGTAGSITLVLQAMLPVMLVAGRPVSALIRGGTDVRKAPAADYFAHVLLPLLARIGGRIELTVVKRGYYPAGGGEARIAVEPSVLRPVAFDQPGSLIAIEGRAHVARLPVTIADRMRDAALGALSGVPGAAPHIESIAISDELAAGQGGAVVVWAKTECSVLGASAVAERGVWAETLGSAVGAELAADVASGAGLDMHAADQLLVYLGLAGGGSYTTRTLTTHARTAMWLIESFLPIRFIVREAGALMHVAAVPTPPV